MSQQEARPYFKRWYFYLILILVAGLALAALLKAQGQLSFDQHGVRTHSLAELPPVACPKVMTNADSAQAEAADIGAVVYPKAPEVVLYASPTTARASAKAGEEQAQLIDYWKTFLRTGKRAFRVVDTPQALAAAGTRLVIVPSASTLNEREQQTLIEHQQRGGSLLVTGPLGSRPQTGSGQDWSLMHRLFNTQVSAETMPEKSEERFLVTSGDGPITHNLPAGTRLWLGGGTQTVLHFAGANPAGWIQDWPRSPNGKAPSLAYGDTQGARWVLFGFSEQAWDTKSPQLQALLAGTLDWLQGRPQAYVAAWPNNHRAAYLTEMDTEAEFDNAINLIALLDPLKIPATFYTLTSVAVDSPATVKLLADGHEIGYHADVHDGFKGQPAELQLQRMENMRKLLFKVHPEATLKATGFRAPYELYDATTERSMECVGLGYHVADPSRTDHRLPILTGANLVVLPRTQRDDMNLIQGATPPAEIAAALKGDLDVLVAQGGLGVLSVHTQRFAKGSPLQQAMGPFLKTLADQRTKVWLATGQDIAQWWRERSKLTVRLTPAANREEIELGYTGKSPLKGATVIVLQPHAAKLVLTPARAGLPQPRILPLDAYRSAVVFDALPGGSYTYQVEFQS